MGSRLVDVVLATAIVLAFLVFSPGPAGAAPIVIYDNGAPDNSLPGANMTQDFTQAADFILLEQTLVTGVTFWTTVGAGNLSWLILEDAVAFDDVHQPRDVIASGIANPDVVTDTTPGGTFLRADFEIAPLTLDAGVYWLALHGGPLTDTCSSGWSWVTTAHNGTEVGMEIQHGAGLADCSGPADAASWGFGGSNWGYSLDSDRESAPEYAFQLRGDSVPEPAVLGLLAVGAIATRMRRRIRRAAAR